MARSYPLTAARAASIGARSIEQIKRDVALRMQDHTHPAHHLNNPQSIESAGIFHLSRHDPSIAQPAASGYHAGPIAGVMHPLAADGLHADRRATSIAGTALPSTVPLTASQLAANSVHIARSTIPTAASMLPDRKAAVMARFFPDGELAVKSAPEAKEELIAKPKLPQSAVLATMHAGALRLEHLLAQPRMQAMLDAMLPQQLARDQILQKPVSPPNTKSNVDRLLYDTINGRVQLDSQPSAAMAAVTAASMASPSAKEPFSRADLLRREARLDALLALSSPEPADGQPKIRMSYDPEEQQREQAERENKAEGFFQSRELLGSQEGLSSHDASASSAPRSQRCSLRRCFLA